jgi:hypothetical protein
MEECGAFVMLGSLVSYKTFDELSGWETPEGVIVAPYPTMTGLGWE